MEALLVVEPKGRDEDGALGQVPLTLTQITGVSRSICPPLDNSRSPLATLEFEFKLGQKSPLVSLNIDGWLSHYFSIESFE